jgi:hypothetical protein
VIHPYHPWDMSEAQWITERPGLGGGTLSTLASYGSFVLNGAVATETTAGLTGTYSYDTWNGIALQMMMGMNGNDLSAVAPDGSAAMTFTWEGYG